MNTAPQPFSQWFARLCYTVGDRHHLTGLWWSNNNWSLPYQSWHIPSCAAWI